MNNEIEIFLENKQYKSESFLFSGGELQVKIRPILQSNTYEELTILCRIQSSNDLVRLILVKEIIDRRSHRGNKKLVIPYFPYARQDRIMEDETESFSLKSISKIINDLKFDEVVTCDPHSDVTAALVNNIKIINQLQLVDKHRDLQELLKTKIWIISPDAGSYKKAFKIASKYGLPLVVASKIRDTTNGKIIKTELPQDLDSNIPSLIVDDICDGGRTFIELAKPLREKGAKQIYLYVTHGIFSKGIQVFDGLIDRIYITDTFISENCKSTDKTTLYI